MMLCTWPEEENVNAKIFLQRRTPPPPTPNGKPEQGNIPCNLSHSLISKEKRSWQWTMAVCKCKQPSLKLRGQGQDTASLCKLFLSVWVWSRKIKVGPHAGNGAPFGIWARKKNPIVFAQVVGFLNAGRVFFFWLLYHIFSPWEEERLLSVSF